MNALHARDLAAQIGKHMVGPARWSAGAVPGVDEGARDRLVAMLTRGDGAAIHVRIEDGRVVFRASWPQYRDGTLYAPDKRLSITCRADRAPAALARELERRLLPEYEPAYRAAVARVRQQDAADGEAASIAERVASAVGGELPAIGSYRRARSGGTVEILRGPSTVHRLQVHPGWADRNASVSFEVSGLDEDTALMVLALLRSADARVA